MLMKLLAVSLFAVLTAAEEIKYSDPKTLVYTDENEGNIKFTYKTYLQGAENLQTAWLWGKIELEDGKQFDFLKGTAGEWEVVPWEDTDQIRIGMMWGIKGQEFQYREQLRFIYEVKDTKLDDYVQNNVDFNTTTDKYQHHRIYSFLMLYRDSDNIDKNKNKNGVEILDKSMDVANRKIMIEFKRPFDVSYDRAFFLQPDEEYQMYLVWGKFTGDKDLKDNVKGMRANLKKERQDPFDKSVSWRLPKPPGWDELQAKLAEFNPNASHASKLSIFVCSLLSMLSLANFF